MAVDAVCDIVAEGMAKHASAVRLIDTVGFAQAAESMAAGMGSVVSVFRDYIRLKIDEGIPACHGIYPDSGQHRFHVIPEAVFALSAEKNRLSLSVQNLFYQGQDCAVNGDDPVLSGSGLHASLKIACPSVFADHCLHLVRRVKFTDSESGIAHDENHVYDRILPVFPENPQFFIREVLMVGLFDGGGHDDILPVFPGA